MADAPSHRNDIDCAGNPIGSLKRMFIDMTMGPRIDSGQHPVRRAVFLKPHGVAHGRFIVNPNLDPALRVGLFARRDTFPAWVRISSDTVPSRPDALTTVGVAIKLFDVTGKKLFGGIGDATHDFILQNHDVFFVDDAAAMCAFTQAGTAGQAAVAAYISAHPTTGRILDEMKKEVSNVLDVPYWSVLPYGFGHDRIVKYKLEPVSAAPSGKAGGSDDPNYLAVGLRTRLAQGEARFRFMVQFQTDPSTMPINAATVRWSESDSPPVDVATLILARQDIEARGQAEYGENLSFNPWRALAEHEPKGDIAEVRRVAYEAGAELRRNVNGLPDGEPAHARPGVSYPPARDRRIVSARIHPAIGIARVGNAKSAYFIGPEVVDPAAAAPGFYRDEEGALKRQAARFRIYGYNAANEAVAELTPDNAEISWSVQLANLKASWYQFMIALDIPEAADAKASAKRNPDAVGTAARAKLDIRPAAKTIGGRDTTGTQYAFDDGAFRDQPVYLGELLTDAAGRLVVLGGRGVAKSPSGASIDDFANNDGWYDDISDGPVTASVSIAGKAIPVDPAWVVVAPPNYAPQLKAVRTMYDLLTQVFIDAGQLAPPSKVSFQNHILPIFERLSRLQWVNKGFASAFGNGGWLDFTSPAMLARLSSKADGPDAELRRQVAHQFRDYDKDSWSPALLPWSYGDAIDIPAAHTPRQHAELAKQQYRCLQRWAAGDFEADYQPDAPPATSLAALAVAEQPAMLDRAALDFCLADAFHPGCEMTWPVRHASMYMAPYRLRHRAADDPDPTYGDTLTPLEVAEFGGLLFGQRAGWLSRWMAVPWHADTASCRSGYEPAYDPYLPTFWPAHVPNQVLTPSDYATLMTGPDPAARKAAFDGRSDWNENTLGRDGQISQVRRMPERFGQMGVVEVHAGRLDDPDIPPVVMVADRPVTPTPPVAGEAVAMPRQRLKESGNWLNRFGRYPHGLTRR